MKRLLLVAALLAGCGGGPTITGTFTLHSDSVKWTTSSCEGTGGYSDIGPGSGVTVKNESGAIIGTGPLVVDAPSSSASQCKYTFSVPVKDAAFYSIEVGRRGALTYSRDEMASRRWTT